MALPSSLILGTPIGEDPAIWDALIALAGPPSLLVAIRSRMSPFLLTRALPEDIWQETLLFAWRDRARVVWQGISAYRRWLLSIAENRIRDLSDREQSEKRGSGRWRSDSIEAVDTLGSILASATPGRLAAHGEEARLMQGLLDELEDEVRLIVSLRLFDELEMKAIAERLELNLATCKSRFRRGAEEYHRRLKAALRTRT